MFIIREKVNNSPLVAFGDGIDPQYQEPLIDKESITADTRIDIPSLGGGERPIEGYAVRQLLPNITSSSVVGSLQYTKYDDYLNAWCTKKWSSYDGDIIPATIKKELVNVVDIANGYYPANDDYYIARFDGFVRLPAGNYSIRCTVDDSIIMRMEGKNGWVEGYITSPRDAIIINSIELPNRHKNVVSSEWHKFGIFYQEYYSSAYMHLYVKDLSTNKEVPFTSLPIAYSVEQLEANR